MISGRLAPNPIRLTPLEAMGGHRPSVHWPQFAPNSEDLSIHVAIGGFASGVVVVLVVVLGRPELAGHGDLCLHCETLLPQLSDKVLGGLLLLVVETEDG